MNDRILEESMQSFAREVSEKINNDRCKRFCGDKCSDKCGRSGRALLQKSKSKLCKMIEDYTQTKILSQRNQKIYKIIIIIYTIIVMVTLVNYMFKYTQ